MDTATQNDSQEQKLITLTAHEFFCFINNFFTRIDVYNMFNIDVAQKFAQQQLDDPKNDKTAKDLFTEVQDCLKQWRTSLEYMEKHNYIYERDFTPWMKLIKKMYFSPLFSENFGVEGYSLKSDTSYISSLYRISLLEDLHMFSFYMNKPMYKFCTLMDDTRLNAGSRMTKLAAIVSSSEILRTAGQYSEQICDERSGGKPIMGVTCDELTRRRKEKSIKEKAINAICVLIMGFSFVGAYHCIRAVIELIKTSL